MKEAIGIDRKYDAVSTVDVHGIELKSGNAIETPQVEKGKLLIRDAWQVEYVLGSKPSRAVAEMLINAGIACQDFYSQPVPR